MWGATRRAGPGCWKDENLPGMIEAVAVDEIDGDAEGGREAFCR